MKDKGRKIIEKKNQALERLVIEYVPAAAIRPNTYNPNRQGEHEFELLIKSMEEDGFTQPIVCQRENREFVDGEHRWTAWIVLNWLKRNDLPITIEHCQQAREKRLDILQEMPDLELPVVFTEMTPEQMRIATLRHNRTRGSEGIQLTAQVLRDLQQLGALDWAQDSLLLDDVEINRLLNDVPVPEALAGEEYSLAWEPDTVAPDDELVEEGATEAKIEQRANYVQVEAMTTQGIEAARQRERKLKEARTEEERQMVKEESNLYRVSLMFSGEEAEIVRSVLGEKPAEKLLALCLGELYPIHAPAIRPERVVS